MSKSRFAVKTEESKSPSIGPPKASDIRPPSPSPLAGVDLVKEEQLKEEEPLSTLSTMDIKTELKAELLGASPSQSPTLNDNEMSSQKFKFSPTPTPPPSTTNGTTSIAPSPSPTPLHTPSATNSKKLQSSGPQLIGNLPVARSEALASFKEILENNYQYKTLGRSREALESMTCDCSYDHGQFLSVFVEQTSFVALSA
jgi:hypothetical protein